MNVETFNEVLKLADAREAEGGGLRELPEKTTLTFYLARAGVGLTVASVEAVILKGAQVQARTSKADLYVIPLEDIFAVNIEGRAQAKSQRRAGFL